MADSTQNFSNHARFVPLWHFFAFPVLSIHVVVVGVRLFGNFSLSAGWDLLVAVALWATLWTARGMAITAQDRIIRGEERARLQRLMDGDGSVDVEAFTTEQLVGMRFASDGELPELASRVAAGELTGRKEIKQAIRNWRADELRV